jgi:hypothetical protein
MSDDVSFESTAQVSPAIQQDIARAMSAVSDRFWSESIGIAPSRRAKKIEEMVRLDDPDADPRDDAFMAWWQVDMLVEFLSELSRRFDVDWKLEDEDGRLGAITGGTRDATLLASVERRRKEAKFRGDRAKADARAQLLLDKAARARDEANAALDATIRRHQAESEAKVAEAQERTSLGGSLASAVAAALDSRFADAAKHLDDAETIGEENDTVRAKIAIGRGALALAARNKPEAGECFRSAVGIVKRLVTPEQPLLAVALHGLSRCTKKLRGDWGDKAIARMLKDADLDPVRNERIAREECPPDVIRAE